MSRILDHGAEHLTVPGIHRAIVGSYEAQAQAVDHRIKAQLYDGTFSPATKLWTGRGESTAAADLLTGQSDSARAQDWSDRQPHSVQCRRKAERLRAGELFAIEANRMLDVLKVMGVDRPEFIHRSGREGVYVGPDDSIRLAPEDEPISW